MQTVDQTTGWQVDSWQICRPNDRLTGRQLTVDRTVDLTTGWQVDSWQLTELSTLRQVDRSTVDSWQLPKGNIYMYSHWNCYQTKSFPERVTI